MSEYHHESIKRRHYNLESKHHTDSESTRLEKLETHMSTDTFGGCHLPKDVTINAFSRNMDSISPIKRSSMLDASKSKSYILAMQSLQKKLETKDKKIQELQKVIETQKNKIESLMALSEQKQAETAKFGVRGLKKESLLRSASRGRDPQGHHHGHPPAYPRFSGDSYLHKENLNPNNNLILESSANKHMDLERGVLVAEIKKLEDEIAEVKNDNIMLVKQLDDSSKATDLMEKKIHIFREQNRDLNDEIQGMSKQQINLEKEIRAKTKENSKLASALDNMQELVNILSAGKPLPSTAKSTAASGLSDSRQCMSHSRKEEKTLGYQMSHNTTGNVLHQGKQGSQDRDMFCLTSTLNTENRSESRGQTSSSEIPNDTETSDSSGAGKEQTPNNQLDELLIDLINHILVNQELTMDHLDLFNHMRERLLEDAEFFNKLESNFEFLSMTKDAILMDGNRLAETNKVTKRAEIC